MITHPESLYLGDKQEKIVKYLRTFLEIFEKLVKKNVSIL